MPAVCIATITVAAGNLVRAFRIYVLSLIDAVLGR